MINQLFGQFNNITQFLKTSGPFTLDLIILFVVFVIFFILTSYFGRQIMIAIILAFYPTNLLYKTFPFIDRLIVLHGDMLVKINKIVIFFIFFLPLTIIISRYISESSHIGATHLLRTVGFSIAGVIIVLLFSYGTVNLDTFHHFSPTIEAIFAGSNKMFWWNIAPLAILAIL